MANLHTPVVRPCRGGLVSFGINGMGVSMYATKHMMCLSSFQDERYGPNLRLHNVQVKDGDIKGYRCTVCGSGNGLVRR